MSGPGPGRPRTNPPVREGKGTQEEILDAAAEFFTKYGFAATSMAKIANAVGVRQNTIYHHFGSKLNLLRGLLVDGVRPGLEMVDALDAATVSGDLDVAAKLYALAVGDAGVLASWRWNLGALYLLPEARAPELEPFQAARHKLREAYVRYARGVTAASGAEDSSDLSYRLVVSVINLRWDGLVTDETPERVGRAVLRLCGITEVSAELDARARTLVEAAMPEHLLKWFPASWT
jgi:AcrR family transcriptional regulator